MRYLFFFLFTLCPLLSAQSLALDVFDGDDFAQVDVTLGANSLLGFGPDGQPARITAGSGITISGNVITSSGGSGGSSTLAGLTDVTLSSPQDQQLLRYNAATGKWYNWTSSYLTSAAADMIYAPLDSASFTGMLTAGGGFMTPTISLNGLSEISWEHASATGIVNSKLTLDESSGTERDAVTWILRHNVGGTIALLSDLSTLSASNLTTGTVNDARLSANVSLLGSSISLTSEVSGTLPLANGGTGQTTASAARIALLPAMSGNGGKYLRVNAGGTDYELATVSGGGGAWGTITGTLSDQSDLAAALSPKANTEQVTAAVSQVWTLDLNAITTTDELAGEYLTLGDASGTVSFWFNLDSGNTDPAAGSRQVEVPLASAGTGGDAAIALQSAIEADAQFSATLDGGVITVTAPTVGALTEGDAGTSGITHNVTTMGAAEVRRLSPYSGEALFSLSASSISSGTLPDARLTGNVSLLGSSISLTSEVSGSLPIANGGTGQTTASAARTALLPAMSGNGGKFLRVNAGATDYELSAISGGGDALTTGSLDQFADVTQAATKTLAITESTTLAGGTHSGTNTGDQTTITGNAGTATSLQTSRTINGVSFNGSADIVVTAAAGTLTGTTLASGVTASSLTSAAGGTFGTAAYTAATAYEVPLTFSTGLTRSGNTVTVNASQSLSVLSNLTSNGFVKTSGGTGALSVDTSTYLTTTGNGSSLTGLTQSQVSGLTTTDRAAFANVKAAHSTLTYAATADIDMDGDGFQTVTLTGNITFTTSNRAAGRSRTVRIVGDTTSRTLTFPSWTFVGAAAPTALAANKDAILTITAFGSADTDVVAAYAAEQ